MLHPRLTNQRFSLSTGYCAGCFNPFLFVPRKALTSMTARIFKPAKNAMQSGKAATLEWQLDYEPEQPRIVEPLMGWTSSGDMKQQVTLRFDTKEEAVAYCERKGIPYQLLEPKEPVRRQAAYADNFAFRRGEPWTH
jgi:ETC complex I subunit conserved region